MTGGSTRTSFLSSTEVLYPGSDHWTEVGELPLSLHGLRGATLRDTEVYMTGRCSNVEDQEDRVVKLLKV